MSQIRRMTVTIEDPTPLMDGAYAFRVRIDRAGEQPLQSNRFMPSEHFDSVFDHLWREVGEEIKRYVAVAA